MSLTIEDVDIVEVLSPTGYQIHVRLKSGGDLGYAQTFSGRWRIGTDSARTEFRDLKEALEEIIRRYNKAHKEFTDLIEVLDKVKI